MSGIGLASLDGGYVEVTPEQIGTLQSQAAGRLIRAGEEGWDKAVLLWNGMIAAAPALVLQPGGARDVATAVRFARDHGLLMSIKSGGHTSRAPPSPMAA
jgi:FAD/FMN-containing dehydrogenase